MLGKKWKPNYATIEEAPDDNMSPTLEEIVIDGSDVAEQKKKKKKTQKLSTKGSVSGSKNISF